MQALPSVAGLICLALIASSCRAAGVPVAEHMPETRHSPAVIPVEPTQCPQFGADMLFEDTPGTGTLQVSPGVKRARWVKINSDLLLDAQGRARRLPPKADITLNLFPDTIYTAVIDEIRDDGNGTTWIGHLEGVENSALIILFTGAVFIGHFASPAGIYEVSSAGDDLYRVIQVDQRGLPGGGSDTVIPTTQP